MARAAASESGSSASGERGIELGHDAEEREAGTQHGLHAVTSGEFGKRAGLAGEQRGRVADVEPLREQPGSGDARENAVEARELLLRCLAVGFIGGEQMRHHGFKAQRRARRKARIDRREFTGQNALAAHTGVNLKMNRE